MKKKKKQKVKNHIFKYLIQIDKMKLKTNGKKLNEGIRNCIINSHLN